MPTAAEIKAWLALVSRANLACRLVKSRQPDTVKGIDWELDQVIGYLDEIFEAGLIAHGEAVIREYLAESEATTPAA